MINLKTENNSTSNDTVPKSKNQQVYECTRSKLEYLESMQETSIGKGMLANLRRGVGKNLGEVPELWGLVLNRFPKNLLGTKGLSNAEWAVYTALTLYALHQQGHSEHMNCYTEVSIGTAVAKLIKNDDDMKRILNRLNLVVTAISPNDVEYHLRGIIQLLSNEGIPLNYSKLARDLYLFRNSDYSENVKLSWGRDFYYEHFEKPNDKGENNNE